MPCWELFAEQDRDVPRRGAAAGAFAARVAIEAGRHARLGRWVGDRGVTVTIDRYGASAPGRDRAQEARVLVENVVAKAKALLE